MLFVVGKLMPQPPKYVHTLKPSTYGYVTLHGKRDFTDIIEGENLVTGKNYLGLSRA